MKCEYLGHGLNRTGYTNDVKTTKVSKIDHPSLMKSTKGCAMKFQIISIVKMVVKKRSILSSHLRVVMAPPTPDIRNCSGKLNEVSAGKGERERARGIHSSKQRLQTELEMGRNYETGI